MRLISKTTFLDFLNCPKNIWLKLHKPELLKHFTLSEFEKHILEQGNEVESYARNLFPGGIEIVSTGEEACQETVRHITSKVPVLFQATFIIEGYIVRNDVLAYDAKNKCWNLYEVKGSNSVKEDGPTDHGDHITDLAFQASVLKRAKLPVGKYFLIHLNKEYVRYGNLDVQKLFSIEDETEKVLARVATIEPQMEAAREYLNREQEPGGSCDCVYKSRKNHCATFHYTNPHVPEYSVHDISRIHKTKLELLVERNIHALDDVPDDFKLSDNQRNQVRAHKSQQPLINKEKIKEELDALVFPLYFFDYEAFGLAIPIFDGYSPYKRIPFQFSLHILREPDGEMEHVEYLHEDRTDPTEIVAKLLEKHIKPGGTVIAWHKSFEAGVNKEIGERIPSYAPFFHRVNSSLYDLKDIFQDQYYVHHGFKGSASLKKVLPAIVSDVHYDGLGIQEGGQAADAWWKMVSPATSREESESIARDLKIYCGVDTYAMYAIWKHLQDMLKS